MSGTSVSATGVGKEVHRADELLRAIGLRLVDEALGMVGIERDVVVDPVPLDEVLESGQAVADALEPGSLGNLVVAPLREAHDVEGDQVLGGGLLLGCDPGDATEVDRLGGVEGLGRYRCGRVSVRLVAHVDPLRIGHSGLARHPRLRGRRTRRTDAA